MSTPAVFFDRDGVVNVSPGDGYVTSWAQFVFTEGVIDAIKLCQQRGYRLVVVTSQQGVGKGLMSMATLDEIHQKMQHALAEHDAEFDAIESCTHLKGSCTCRKPSAEMILRAAEKLDLDLSRSWLIGDHDRDIQMAANARVPNTIRVLSHHEASVVASFTVESPSDLAGLLVRVLPLSNAGLLAK